MHPLIGPAIATPLLALASSLVCRSERPDPPIPLEDAARCFEQARRLSDADGGRLWGKPVYGPFLFADPQTRALVANEPDTEGRLRAERAVFVGALPEDQNIANTAVTWAGRRWTMVMWPPPDATYARARLMTHELFHRIQDDLGLPAASPGNNHLDSAEGRTWLQLELRALAEALIHTGRERDRAASDAILFRAYRRSLFSATAADEERGLEMNEGLAEYTGYRLCGLPEHVLPDRVAVRIETHPTSGSYTRNFAYLTGPAYGLLLDAARPAWRTGLTPQHDLADLLRGAPGVDPAADLAGAAAEASARYDGPRLIALEHERERLRQERLDGYRRRFAEGPVLSLPLSPDVRYSYNPNGVEAFDDSSSVYQTTRVVDGWGVLVVESGGALLRRERGRMAEVTVPAPEDAQARPLAGEGWTLTLNEGWRLGPGPRPGDLLGVRTP